MRNIRNFSIIAHVDHGKSTLADRIIQLCGGLTAREMESQVLDTNPIERERGITIKAQSVSLPYRSAERRGGKEWGSTSSSRGSPSQSNKTANSPVTYSTYNVKYKH